MTVSKTFASMKAAERYQMRLYNKYDYVRLVRSPWMAEAGVYVWDVR